MNPHQIHRANTPHRSSFWLVLASAGLLWSAPARAEASVPAGLSFYGDRPEPPSTTGKRTMPQNRGELGDRAKTSPVPVALSFEPVAAPPLVPEATSLTTRGEDAARTKLSPGRTRRERQKSPSSPNVERPDPQPFEESNTLDRHWWDRGSDSPVAVAIGHAEGTRGANGSKSPAYYWHRDPGNGADNFGTFSYQHLSAEEKFPVRAAASTDRKRQAAADRGLPERADRLQLQRLQQFRDRLVAQAGEKGLELSPLELLNGLDLANQSPNAALNWMGYIDRLAQMKQRDLDPLESIIEARTWSYWNPHSHRWDASGLGNTYESIRRDQQRRAEAVDRVVRHYTERCAREGTGNLSAETVGDRVVFCPLGGL